MMQEATKSANGRVDIRRFNECRESHIF